LGAILLLLTKFRPQLQDDRFYSTWIERQEERFRDFHAENVVQPQGQPIALPPSHSTLEDLRVERYKSYRGLFLVHSWRPSQDPTQVADIIVEIRQHREGPLSEGLIDRVEYCLGPLFFDGGVVKHNGRQNFRLEISAYGPALCLARVHFKDGTEPVLLERYIDFEGSA